MIQCAHEVLLPTASNLIWMWSSKKCYGYKTLENSCLNASMFGGDAVVCLSSLVQNMQIVGSNTHVSRKGICPHLGHEFRCTFEYPIFGIRVIHLTYEIQLTLPPLMIVSFWLHGSTLFEVWGSNNYIVTECNRIQYERELGSNFQTITFILI